MSKLSMGARITSLGAAVLARVPGISHAPRPVRGEIVGVDLGGSAVKIARMRRRAGGAELLDFVDDVLCQPILVFDVFARSRQKVVDKDFVDASDRVRDVTFQRS